MTLQIYSELVGSDEGEEDLGDLTVLFRFHRLIPRTEVKDDITHCEE